MLCWQVRGLPDDYLLLGGEVELVAGLDAEGFKEGGDVAQGDVDAVLCEGVYVADGQVALLSVAAVCCPDVGVVEVEGLLGSKSVDEGFFRLDVNTLGFLCVEEGGVADAKTTLVADVLAEGVRTVGHQAGEDFDFVELVS